VGLAARLEAAAAPSQILLSEETARRADGFELVDLGQRAVRGLAEPVRVFELVGERAEAAAFAAARAGRLSPFVGRAAELAQLRRRLGAGRCSRIELRGEAGIGKSRLVWEALRPRAGDTAVLELVCREASARRAYVPWLHLLRRWPPELPGGEAASGLAFRLDGTAETPCEPEQAARAARALLLELLAERTVVIVIDDAHWLDPSSRRLVQALTAEPPEGALSWVATLREEQASEWCAGAPAERIALPPLPVAEARRLAELAAGDVGPEIADLACLRGGGNPLFVEEVARALREGSEAQREAARLELTLARARERIPETLWGVVAARIDALPETAKRVLEMAAVVGEAFEAELVGDVIPGLPDAPDAMLALLVERGLLRPRAGGEYEFCHGVVQAGAEAQLVRERLTSLHRRIAEALAKRPLAGSAEGASRIGHHFDRAGEGASALPHLLRAGHAYAALRALPEAVAHLRRAFELVRAQQPPPAELEAPVGIALASALAALDRTGEAAAVLESIDAERAAADDRLQLASVHVQAGWLRFSNENDVARGRALIERGLRASEGLAAASDTRLLAWSYLTRIDLLDGRLAESLEWTRRAAERAAGTADRTGLALARYNECWIHCEAGALARAHDTAEDLGELVASGETDLVEGMARIARARVHLFEGDAEAALAEARFGDDCAARSGQLGFRSHAAAVCGYAHLLRGDVRAARDCFERLAELGPQWPTTLLHRARGALETGDLHEAAALAAGAADAPRAVRARALAVRGLALGLGAGRRDEAERLLAESIELCDALRLRPWLAEALGFQAELHARRGDREGAAHYAARAADVYASCGMRVHAAQAIAHGEVRP
jgi:tetratricopeptide (TPR) repeat protein